jgi:hypothetical protein
VQLTQVNLRRIMWSQNWRGGSPDTPCQEYEKLQLVAEDLLANVGETTSLEQFEQAQKSLLSLFQELKERMDPWHFRLPGRHRCLEHCYLHYAMLLRNRAILQKPLPPPVQKPQPVTLEALLANVEQIIAESATETPFGEEREEPGT